VLIHQAIGDQLTCVYVDTGMMRKGESEQVVSLFSKHYDMNLIHVDAGDEFLNLLQGVSDPERKRKIIGGTFIDIFEREAKKAGGAKFLAQGTLYPDVIESVSFDGGPSVTIKSHHNVGGLPERMDMDLVEPLRELFKDEVRKLGQELGLHTKGTLFQGQDWQFAVPERLQRKDWTFYAKQMPYISIKLKSTIFTMRYGKLLP